MATLRSCGYVDPGWEHGIAQDERKKKVKCKYCGKVVSGGIYRLKQHLARISGEVTYCDKAPEEVCLKMRENLEGCRISKKPRQLDYEEQSYLNLHSNDDAEEDDHTDYRNKGKQVVSDKGLVINLTPRSLGYVDPGWEHGVPQDERKKKVKCNYCEKVVSGGINRFKQHLAKIPGEVAPCKNVPEDVYVKIKENMKWHRTGRRQRRSETSGLSTYYMNSENEDETQEEEHYENESPHYMNNERLLLEDNRFERESRRASKGVSPSCGSAPLSKRPLDQMIVKTTKPFYSSSRLCRTSSDRLSRKEVMSAICKFFYHAGVPMHAADSPYFHKMLDLVAQYGEESVGPSSRIVSGRFLQDEIITINNYLLEYKASWAFTGCSILADSWRDMQDRILINILVSCPRGVYFVRSIDVTDFVEDATYLFKLLDKVVEDMGEENVVQVVTAHTPSFQLAGKMLEERRRNIFWTPCAADCIDGMLGDFMKIKWVADCLEKAQKITRFIYNRIGLLSIMKKEFTGGQDLLRPSFTRNASSFTTMQGLVDNKVGLKRLFQSNQWLSFRFSKTDEGKEVEKLVLSATFWKKVINVGKSVGPIVEVLQKINCEESLSMPFIYNDMYRAKLAIKDNHADDPRKYPQFWSVIDNHWNSLSHHPLYLAAYFLNPSYHYHPDFVPHPDVVRGLNACIVRLEPDSGRRISASMQISDFGSAKADFGTDLAISTRMELNPAAWWQQHGINCLDLQKIAVRILSQTCSSFGCEHNWSVYDQIHNTRQNGAAQKQLNDVLYVHYNLRLRERQVRGGYDYPIFLDSVMQENILYEWVVETEKQVFQEDEEIPYSETEQADAYENDLMECEDRNSSPKGFLGTVTLSEVPEPLQIDDGDAGNAGATNDDDGDLNSLDEDSSD